MISAWISWLLISLFYAYQYVLRILPLITKGDIVATFSLTDTQFGQFAGMYYIAYAVAHIPLGLLISRYSPKLF